MNEIFVKRRKVWYRQNIKYLRYVFNDHFVLFLMILFGALAAQYITFLQSHELKLVEKIVLLLFVTGLSQVFGRLATFIEGADKVFFLVKELEVRSYLRGCWLRSLILPGVISLCLVGLVTPLLQFAWFILLLWFLVLVGIKAIWLEKKLHQLQRTGVLDWSSLIVAEEARKTGILRFFAMFTTVKGLKAHSHRRKYLDFLLPKTKRTYDYLFTRAFLRSGDYLGLTLRLILLSVLTLFFVSNGIVAAILVSVFNYLLIFQLLSLRSIFDYQLLTRIYPLKKVAKTAGLRLLLLRIMLFITAVEVGFALIFLRPLWLIIPIVVVNFLLTKFYIRLRLKKF